MNFNSYMFIMCFFPVSILGYFALNRLSSQLGLLWLLLVSLIFYGWGNAVFVLLLLGSIIVNYGFSIFLRGNAKTAVRKGLLFLGIVFNLVLLGYFKYYNFFLSNLGVIFKQDMNLKKIILPLGISYFTFQQIAFLVDCYKEKCRYSLLQYACFVAFFPKISLGPIMLHRELMGQFSEKSRKEIQWTNLSRGIYIFSIGLAKKVLIADTFGSAVNAVYGNIEGMSSITLILGAVFYAFQLYFDFSGYSDMAIGIAAAMNFDLIQNFDSPYKAVDMVDFWKRWHISLTRFLTKYVYIPLGGSRKGTVRTYINIVIVFLVSGLWHGAGYNFILWGLINGIGNCVSRLLNVYKVKRPKILGWFLTVGTWTFSLIYFRAESIAQGNQFLRGILNWKSGGISPTVFQAFHLPEVSFVAKMIGMSERIDTVPVVMIFFLIVAVIILAAKNTKKLGEIYKPTILNLLYSFVIFFWSFCSMAGVSNFLYFNF